uniref:Uncharacterized protein n=1 Tax=Oncorhynchus tshawytscha TaxID=74940 RepID=A0A8C8G9X1_ONCTS
SAAVLEWRNCLHCQIALAALIVVKCVTHAARHEKEKYFLSAAGEKEKYFLSAAGETEPFLHDHSSLELSVVVPAYNEELRSQ